MIKGYFKQYRDSVDITDFMDKNKRGECERVEIANRKTR
jgi:hypothetical protein